MTTFLLIRHAEHDLVADTLAGRMPGVALNASGRTHARRLARRLALLPVAAIYSSPMQRAVETAGYLAERFQLAVQCCDGFTEIDFGEWKGKRFDELAADPRWRRWNSFRSSASLPNGGLMIEIQLRTVETLERLRLRHPGEVVAIISHSDVIKAVIAYYLGAPLDLMQRIRISPTGVSVVNLHEWGAEIARINDMGDLWGL